MLWYISYGDNMKIVCINKNIDVIVCNTYFKRLKGFMFRKKKIDYGLCFPKCKSIHTFFMRQPIDIICASKDNKIVALYYSIKPNKIIRNKDAYYFYELPIDSIHGFEIDDYIEKVD